MTSGANFDTQSEAEKQGGAPSPPPPAAGDAGNSFLNDMLSGLDPMDTESVKQFSADAQKIKDLADAGPGAGGFAIDPDAGQKYIDAIKRFVEDAWPGLDTETQSLKDNPQLGTSDYATEVAAHDVKVMDSGDEALLPNMILLVGGLKDLRAAVDTAMRSYRAEDESHKLTFKAVGVE